MSDAPDHYKTLQVDDEAEAEVIQAAYRRLARKYHPDAGGGPHAAERMTALNAAWEVLRDPAHRAAYDTERRAAAQRRTSLPGSPQPSRSTSTQPGASDDRASRTTESSRPAGDAWRKEERRAENANPNWGSGRSTQGGGYDPATMGRAQGTGAAGPPPGRPSGSVLNFGRYAGWSLGEVARRDLEYLEWLDRAPIGRQYQAELDQLLRAAGRRRTHVRDQQQRGLFRRR